MSGIVAPDNTGIAAIKAKTDKLQFAAGDDVIATLDGEVPEARFANLRPRYLSSYVEHLGVEVTAEEAEKAVFGSLNHMRMTLPAGGGQRTVAVFAVDDITYITQALVGLSHSAESVQIPHGEGNLKVFLARDVNGFAPTPLPRQIQRHRPVRSRQRLRLHSQFQPKSVAYRHRQIKRRKSLHVQ